MTQDELTSETVATQAADWVSTVLSIPMIWPRMTVVVCLSATLLAVSSMFVQLSRPAVPPLPPLDRARVAEIEARVRIADAAIRETNANVNPLPTGARGFLESITDSDHGGMHHDAPRVHAH